MKFKEIYRSTPSDDSKRRIVKREFELNMEEIKEILRVHCQNVMLKMNPDTGIFDPNVEIRYQIVDCGNAGMVLEQYFEYKD